MSATEELRRLLDERGVEWKGYKCNPWTDTTAWDIDASDPRREVEAGFMEFTDTGVTLLRFWNATPEQAIATTFGSSNCTNDCMNSERMGTCKIHDCEGSFSAVNRPVWRCDCGAFMTQYTDATTYHKPRYCPNCGRKVAGEWA